jgi:hypothetical protein
MINRLDLKLCVTIAAVLALAPAAASAASSHSTSFGNADAPLGASVGALDYSGLFALEFPSSGDIGPRLSGEVMYGVTDLTPGSRLKLGARASFAYHGSDLWLIEGVPDVKIAVALNDLLAFYGDIGLGLAVLSGSGTDAAFTVQFGAGVAYVLNPHVNLLGEVRVNLYTRSGSTTFVSFPTVGLQFH